MSKIKKKIVAKKIAKKKFVAKKIKIAKEKPIGKITHYYSKIKVAVLKLNIPVKVGTTIEIIGGEGTKFKQKIKSMQIDFKTVKMAKKGKAIGVKMAKRVREGYKVFKVK